MAPGGGPGYGPGVARVWPPGVARVWPGYGPGYGPGMARVRPTVAPHKQQQRQRVHRLGSAYFA